MGSKVIVSETVNPSKSAYELLTKTLIDDKKVSIPINVYEIAERLGIEVQRLPLDEGTDGILVKEEASGSFKAVIDVSANSHRARFTLAHEIGHYVKDYQDFPAEKIAGIVQKRDDMSSTGKDPDEVWANQFAAYLLMPSSIVEQLWANNTPIEEMAKMLDVSIVSLSHRLKNLGLAQ